MLHLGDEEAFTALLQNLDKEDKEAFSTLLQNLDEEDKQLLQPFQYPVDDSGLIEEELQRLLKGADVYRLIEKPDEFNKHIKYCQKDPPLPLKPSEIAPYSRTQLLQLCFMIIRRILLKLAAFSTDTMAFREFFNSNANLFLEALQHPDHKYKPEAEVALQGFTKAVEKSHVTSLNKVSKAYGIPVESLAEWVAKGLIPVHHRDKNAIYITKEIAEEVARDNQEAKALGRQTARLLREWHDKYFPPAVVDRPSIPVSPETPTTELQLQATLGSETKQPIHYPHENVVFHVVQLQAEAQGKQRAKRGTVKSYEVVATLRDAAERTGVAEDEILTTRDIEAEYHINKMLVHDYTRRGRQGRPHLTPLDVRLARGGGSSQLLFRRGDIERIVANPPKTGRPPK